MFTIINPTSEFSGYMLEDTIDAELNNNLTIINSVIANSNIGEKPDFYILGGAALVFHGLSYKSTHDIDTANKIENNVKVLVDQFIDDMSSEVSTLGYSYKDRSKQIRQDLGNINVYILGLEDLFLTKLGAFRRKDIDGIVTTKLHELVDMNRVQWIIDTEYEKTIRDNLNKKLEYLMAKLKAVRGVQFR